MLPEPFEALRLLAHDLDRHGALKQQWREEEKAGGEKAAGQRVYRVKSGREAAGFDSHDLRNTYGEKVTTANLALDLGGAESSRIRRFWMKVELPDPTVNRDMGVEDMGKLDPRDRKKQDIRIGEGTGGSGERGEA